MDLAGFQAVAFASRRARLAAELGDRPALIAAGTPRARNYAANTFPFRATSHFLYLFGLPLRGAFGFYDGATWALYLPGPGPDDALWEGASPSLSSSAGRGARCARSPGCRRRPAARWRRCPRPTSRPARSRAASWAAVRRGVLDARRAAGRRDDRPAPAPRRRRRRRAALRRRGHRRGPPRRHGARRAPGSRSRCARRWRPSSSRAGWAAPTRRSSRCTARSSTASAPPTLADGDLLLADVGAETPGGWAGDVTRTWPVYGTLLAHAARAVRGRAGGAEAGDRRR